MRKPWLFAILAAIFVSTVIMMGLSSPCPRGCHADMRRVADLHQIQQQLRFYFSKCGVYPGGTPKPGSDPTCIGVSKPAELAGSLLNIPAIPKDSTTGADYSYCYIADGSSYVLQAKLDYNSNAALANSLTEPPNGCTNTVGTVTCDKSKGEYCVGP
jgi:hypothetical protein